MILVLTAAGIQGCGGKPEKTGALLGEAVGNQTESQGLDNTAGTPGSGQESDNGNIGSVKLEEEAALPGKPAYATPATAGALHVEGTQLVGSNKEPVQLRGISTHGLAWFPEYVNEECFRQLREEWNVNVLRLAMYTAESGGYCTDGNKEQLKALIENGVSYAADHDLYVIIDWHILSDGNPNTHLDEAKVFFDEMSRKYANGNHVIYEICNEPNGGTGWAQIKSYAKEVISVIRANDEDAVILVGTPNWSQYVDEAAQDPITEFDNLMYTLHFYAATHTDDLRARLSTAVDAGLPVFVSEYGICDASGNGEIDENQANQWVELLNQYNISYVAWNLSNKNETSALLSASCHRTSGFTKEDLSDSGKWLYGILTGERPFAAPGADAGGKVDLDTSGNDSGDISGASQSMTFTEAGLEVTAEDTLTDGWNGNYMVQGTSLHITSKDYNGTIPPGAWCRMSDLL